MKIGRKLALNWFWSGEKISKVLSKREKALIILLLLLTILYTYYTWILSPLLRKIDLLNREKHDLLAQVAELQKSTPDKILDNSVEEEQLLTLWQQVPATSAIPEAISNLQKMAEESGVVLHRIYFKKLSEAGQETFKMGELQEEEIEIRAVGGYDGLRAFIAKIEQTNKRIMVLSQSRIQSGERNFWSKTEERTDLFNIPQLQADLSIQLFYDGITGPEG
jgi:Tfp pilus assembly protein PilO